MTDGKMSPINRNSVLNWDEVAEFIRNTSEQTTIYVGVDSKRFLKGGGKSGEPRRYFASYAKVIVVHIDSKHGCKLFGEVVTLPEFEKSAKKGMRMRLMQEVYMAGEMAGMLQPMVGKRVLQVHLDINRSPEHDSNSVMKEAIGYIRGLCGIDPIVKPDSLAAMACADYITRRY